MSYFDDAIAKVEQFEGCVPWMYRDTLGNVTVGSGTLLPDSSHAIALPFQVSGRAASAGEIGHDFLRVLGLPFGPSHAAAAFRSPGSPTLGPYSIAAMLKAVLGSSESVLRAHLEGYDALPDGVKMALLDMIYNLGAAGLFTKFPRFIQAVRDRNWQAAEAQCNRPQLGMPRNTWTREQFANL